MHPQDQKVTPEGDPSTPQSGKTGYNNAASQASSQPASTEQLVASRPQTAIQASKHRDREVGGRGGSL